MNNDNDFDPVTRACRCEKCGEWIYEAAPHQCKPLSQLDEAVRNRDYRIAELEAQINDAGDTDIGWYRQELSTSAVVLKELRTRIAELEATIALFNDRFSDLASENESLKGQIAELTHEKDKAFEWLGQLGIGLSFEVVPAEKSENLRGVSPINLHRT